MTKDIQNDDAQYQCDECGEEWEAKYTPFYANGKCANCGASPSNKVIKDRDNPLTRDGEQE